MLWERLSSRDNGMSEYHEAAGSKRQRSEDRGQKTEGISYHVGAAFQPRIVIPA